MNCLNKVKILPAPVIVAGGGATAWDDVFDELRALLGDKYDALTFVDQPDERWIETPIESDGENVEVVAVIWACIERDVEEADDSTAVDSEPSQSWKCAEMKTFFHENQGEHPELRK